MRNISNKQIKTHSVTKWLDSLLNIWPLKQIGKLGLNFYHFPNILPEYTTNTLDSRSWVALRNICFSLVSKIKFFGRTNICFKKLSLK